MSLVYNSPSYEHLACGLENKHSTQIRHSTVASGPEIRTHCVCRQQLRGLNGGRQASAVDIPFCVPSQAISESQINA